MIGMKFYFVLIIIFSAFNLHAEDRIIVAKTLITLDDNYKNVNAVLVRKDKIFDVGTFQELKLKYPNEKVDKTFHEHVLIPGFIEHHIHPLLAAITMNSEIIAIDNWDLVGKKSSTAKNREEYLKQLKQLRQSHKSDTEPIVSWGFHHYFHGDLTRQDLDSISNEIPILIIHRSFHEFIMNSKALEFFNINEDDLKPLSEDDKKLANIQEGHFSERGLIAVMPKTMNYLASPQKIIKGLEITESYIQENGITLIGNPGAMYDRNIQEVKNYVFSDIETPFRSMYIPSALYMLENVEFNNLIEATEDQLTWGNGKVEFMPNHIKLFSDGAMYSQNMVMRDGYIDGHQGVWLMEDQIFQDVFKLYWELDYQIHIHQNGDAGLDRILDVLESNINSYPRKNHRTTIVHFGYSALDQVKRMKNLDVIVSANPYYVTVLSDLYSREGVGYERSQEMVRLGDLKRNNILFSLHSDMPMAPAKPLTLMDSAINRTNYANETAGPAQKISPLDALEAVTINSAYVLGLESMYGSITPKKYANFTVLSKNPLTIDTKKIKDIKIIATIVEGKFYIN